MKQKVIIFIGHFLPGYKSGGPVVSVQNLIDTFSDKVDFFVVTNPRDINSQENYKGIRIDEWNNLNGYNIFYTNLDALSPTQIKNLCSNFDYVYCCCFYGMYVVKLMRLFKKNKIKNLIIASMGVFLPNALKIKSIKKKTYIWMLKVLGLFKNIVWSVTDEQEKYSIEKIIKTNKDIIVACDLPSHPVSSIKNHKQTNVLRIVYLSRIVKNKNLLFAIKALKNCTKENIEFDIYGFIEDNDYWQLCQTELNQLSQNIKYNYKGPVNHNNVMDVFMQYDLFVFPTMSENFGHVIYEAMASSCPPLISNNTYWQNLQEKKAGVCIDINNENDYSSKIIEFYNNRSMLDDYKKGAREYALAFYEESKRTSGYKVLFNIKD